MTSAPNPQKPSTEPINETIQLERTGNAPLRFTGHLVSTVCGQFVEPPKDKPNMDYYTISVYSVSDRPRWFVVAIDYTKAFRDPIKVHAVWQTSHVADVLTSFDPVAVVIGMPPNIEDRANRQALLESKCKRQYQILVSAVLTDFPEALPLPGEFDEVTPADFERAARTLAASGIRGRASLDYLLDWFDDDGLDLPPAEQAAVFTLLKGAWGCCRASADEVIDKALTR